MNFSEGMIFQIGGRAIHFPEQIMFQLEDKGLLISPSKSYFNRRARDP